MERVDFYAVVKKRPGVLDCEVVLIKMLNWHV